MEMYDEVIFSYRLPNGREGGHFQTTDLECTQDRYEVTTSGRLVRVRTQDVCERPVGDLSYTGWLDIRDAVEEYRLEFTNGSLRAIQIMDEDEWVLFDPANCIET